MAAVNNERETDAMTTPGDATWMPRRLLLLPLAAGVVLAAAGSYPTWVLKGEAGLKAMLAAEILVIAVVYVTLVPVMRRMTAAEPVERLRLAIKAGVVRMIGTLAVAGAVAWRGRLDTAAFLLWVAMAYVILVKAETLALYYWNRRLESHS